MDSNQMRDFWTKKYTEFEGEEYRVVGNRSWSYNEYIHNSKDIIEEFKSVIKPGDTALDFGCGIGRLRPLLQNYYRQYIGVDVVKKIDTEEEYQIKGGASKVIYYDSKDFLVSNIKVDAVFCCVVLQHIVENSELTPIIDKFRQILPLGGLVYLNEQVGNGETILRKGMKYIKSRSLQEYMNLFCGFKLIKQEDRKEAGHKLIIFERIKDAEK